MNRTNELVAETEESLSSLRMNGGIDRDRSLTVPRLSIQSRQYQNGSESRFNNEPNGETLRKINDRDDNNERGTGKATNNTSETWRKRNDSDESDKRETNEEFTQIYVKNIGRSSNEMDIRKLFEKFGEITSVAIFNGRNGKPNCCCRVEYNNSKNRLPKLYIK